MQQPSIPVRAVGIALLATGLALLFGCASQTTSTTYPESIPANHSQDRKQLPAANAASPHSLSPEFLIASLEPMSPVPEESKASGEVEKSLPTLGSSFDTMIPTWAEPGSSFISQSMKGLTQDLPASVGIRDGSIGIVLGHTGGSQYTTGLGWATERSGENRLKLSLLRQQSLDNDFNGQWLANLQGELTDLPLGEAFNLKGELALAVDNTSSLDAGEVTGGSIRLTKTDKSRLSYGLGLSQFGERFQPGGSLVEAGVTQAEADLQYLLGSNLQLSASMDYIEYNTDGAAHRCENQADLALSGHAAFTPLKARFETSRVLSRDCVGKEDHNVDSWKLWLTEKTLTGWALSMAMSGTTVWRPLTGKEKVKRSYRLNSQREFRLGPHLASFGPTLSLNTHDDGDVWRRLKAGIALDMDMALQSVNFRLGYESLSGDHDLPTDKLDVRVTYRLDLDV